MLNHDALRKLSSSQLIDLLDKAVRHEQQTFQVLIAREQAHKVAKRALRVVAPTTLLNCDRAWAAYGLAGHMEGIALKKRNALAAFLEIDVNAYVRKYFSASTTETAQ